MIRGSIPVTVEAGLLNMSRPSCWCTRCTKFRSEPLRALPDWCWLNTLSCLGGSGSRRHFRNELSVFPVWGWETMSIDESSVLNVSGIWGWTLCMLTRSPRKSDECLMVGVLYLLLMSSRFREIWFRTYACWLISFILWWCLSTSDTTIDCERTLP